MVANKFFQSSSLLKTSISLQNCDLEIFCIIHLRRSTYYLELAPASVNNLAQPAIARLTAYFQFHPQLKPEDQEATVRVMLGTLI